MRRALYIILLSISWVSCQSARSSVITDSPIQASTPTVRPLNTPARVIPSATPTLEIPTATATPICEPASTFCVLDGHFFFQHPLSSTFRLQPEMTYLFGETEHDTLEPHHGIDIPNASGTPVMAAADGSVIFADSDRNNFVGPYENFYGNVIIIKHSFAGIQQPVYSLYGHLSEIDVAQGQSVQAGQLIGKVGMTGIAMGSHLHFEVRLGANSYYDSSNPALWLIPLEGTGSLVIRIADQQGNMLPISNLKIQYYDKDVEKPTSTLRAETYGYESARVLSDEHLQENFAVGDLTAGKYQASFNADFTIYSRWIEIQAGKLTYLEFVVK
jgi:hypothetical protein